MPGSADRSSLSMSKPAHCKVMKMLEPVEMPLPYPPHIFSRRDLGAPQTRRGRRSADLNGGRVCATRLEREDALEGLGWKQTVV